MAQKNFFKNAAKVVAKVFICLIGIAVFPIVFLGTALFAKKMAKLFNKNTKGELGEYIRDLLSAEVAISGSLLPKSVRFKIFEVAGKAGVSTKTELDYYFERARTAETVMKLSRYAYNQIWKEPLVDMEDVRAFWAKGLDDVAYAFNALPSTRKVEIVDISRDERFIGLLNEEEQHEALRLTKDYDLFFNWGFTFNDEEFKRLIFEGEHEKFMRYVAKQTPSDAIVKELIAQRDKWHDELDFCVRKYGLSPKVVESIDEDVLDELEKAMMEYTQRTFVSKNEDGAMFKQFMKLCENDLCVAAQKCLKPSQYKIFHELNCGLDSEAIEHFLSKGDVEMFRLILSYEIAEGGHNMTTKAAALIATNPTFLNMFMKWKVEHADPIGKL